MFDTVICPATLELSLFRACNDPIFEPSPLIPHL